MTTEIAEGVPWECEICGTTDNLKCAPIMTGDSFGQPCQHPVCDVCIETWYESGETDAEKLKVLSQEERVRKLGQKAEQRYGKIEVDSPTDVPERT